MSKLELPVAGEVIDRNYWIMVLAEKINEIIEVMNEQATNNH